MHYHTYVQWLGGGRGQKSWEYARHGSTSVGLAQQRVTAQWQRTLVVTTGYVRYKIRTYQPVDH